MLISRTDDRAATLHALAAPAQAFVACLCAAWCRTCDDFRPAIEDWARQRADVSVVWLDVEDDADLVGDIEVENFPTLLIQRDGAVRFFGPIPPRVSPSVRSRCSTFLPLPTSTARRRTPSTCIRSRVRRS